MTQKLYDRSFTVYGDEFGLSLFRHDKNQMNVIFMKNMDDIVDAVLLEMRLWIIMKTVS